MPRARFLSLVTLLGIFAITGFAQDDEEKIKQKHTRQHRLLIYLILFLRSLRSLSPPR